ncbi:hypothetical protein AVEN_190536-1 [Araneus ventricosus]|uniref:Uncharacterized protein n=1 Tax=Araneus ventricosus TaxID=182803 RepID=A0A4Y2CCL5_ARAVE|nr:hypothetical protein AVEN_190536-1 [Araneus ventricosus]
MQKAEQTLTSHRYHYITSLLTVRISNRLFLELMVHSSSNLKWTLGADSSIQYGDALLSGGALEFDLADHVSQHAGEQEAEEDVDLDSHREVVDVRVAQEEAEEAPEVEVGKGRLTVVGEHQAVQGYKKKKKTLVNFME